MDKRPSGKPLDAAAPWGGMISREAINREKNKARELRQSPWWKRRLGNGRCYYCRKPFRPEELTMDHVVPLVRGGKTTRSNVVPACKTCNTQKKELVPVEWEAYLQRIQEDDSGSGTG